MSEPLVSPLSLERQRLAREQERSSWAAVNQRTHLQALHRSSSTEYGRVLFDRYAEDLTIALGSLLERLVEDPSLPGPHYSAWPLLLQLQLGPRPVVSIALSVVIDWINERPSERSLSIVIGAALQHELKACKIKEKSRSLATLICKRHPEVLKGTKTLKQLRVDVEAWTLTDKRELGGFLLGLILAKTPLLQVDQRGRTVRLMATPATLALIAAHPPRPLPARRLPSLVPPKDWQGMQGGGHLDNERPLVRTQSGISLQHLTPQTLAPVLGIINGLQSQELRIDPVMVGLQRAAWDCGIRGLFPVFRDPLERPVRPSEHCGAQVWAMYCEGCRRAEYDRLQYARTRSRIDQAIRVCEEVAGLPVWFAYCLDFRGRMYTTNRLGTNQGPDWEKAAVNFSQPKPTPQPSGLNWMFRAAAGHYGRTDTWSARQGWAEGQIPAMRAIVASPFDRLELWRDAKAPWQYLQLARAICHQLDHPGAPSAVPLRFDQTCSGIGISAALIRDKRLAEFTNIAGTERQDIYGHFAERLQERLRFDLSEGSEIQKKHAESWLQFGVDRTLCKTPVMASIYGARHLGFVDHFAGVLEERQGGALPVQAWGWAYITPSIYLARKLYKLLKEELSSCFALQRWLRRLSKAVVSKGQELGWVGPSDFPVRLDAAFDARTSTRTLTRGRRRWRAWNDEALPGERSARDTNRSITANTIHSFDGAFCHQIISACLNTGVHVMTNHDCFSVMPADAGWLHETVHAELRKMYAPDLLADVMGQISRVSGLKKLPEPPMVSTLNPDMIGSNPYCFS